MSHYAMKFAIEMIHVLKVMTNVVNKVGLEGVLFYILKLKILYIKATSVINMSFALVHPRYVLMYQKISYTLSINVFPHQEQHQS